MKAIINELWNTGREIVTTKTDNEGFAELDIESVADLRMCENVLVGDKIMGIPSLTEIIIDDTFLEVHFTTVSHPTGFGKLRVCEIF